MPPAPVPPWALRVLPWAGVLLLALGLSGGVTQGAPVRAPAVSGSAQVGSPLTASGAKPMRWEAERATTVTQRKKVNGRIRVVKKTVLKWSPLPGATSAGFTPTDAVLGLRLRACSKARGARPAWKCSSPAGPVAPVLVAAVPPAPAAPAPAPAAPAPAPAPPKLAISYPASTTFTAGDDRPTVSPTVTGGKGTRSFAFSGTLPPGVTFGTSTGVFTGPAAAAWDFRAVQVSAGGASTCAVTSTGGVKCWGGNTYDQLGNASPAVAGTPVDVLTTVGAPLSGATQVAVGRHHACAVLTSGGLSCWGDGASGKRGDGTTANSAAAVPVVGTGGAGALGGVVQVVAGANHTCALTSAGDVLCWGDNYWKQLGDPSAGVNRSVPGAVAGPGSATSLTGVRQIAAGHYHVCAVGDDTGVVCWGKGATGALGDGFALDRNRPVRVLTAGTDQVGPRLTGVEQVAAGYRATCALRIDGGVLCWGYGEAGGALGNGAEITSLLPVTVRASASSPLPLRGAVGLSLGQDFGCAVLLGGGAKCWGTNSSGALGKGTPGGWSTSPVDVHGVGDVGLIDSIRRIGGLYYHSCAVLSSGRVACWGSNTDGKVASDAPSSVGPPWEVSQTAPIAGPVTGTVTATDSTGSSSDTVSIAESPRPVATYAPVLGAGANSPVVSGGSGTPAFAFSGTLPGDVTFGAAGGVFTGSAAAWNFRSTQVSGGEYHTCAVTDLGRVKCWGGNSHGELGDGTTDLDPHTTPADVVGPGGTGTLSDIVQVAVGRHQTCALTGAGHVWCWGANERCQLGQGGGPCPLSPLDSPVPLEVVGPNETGVLANVVEVAAGDGHNCARTSAGEAYCWGFNAHGQIGIGNSLPRDDYRIIAPGPTKVVGVADSDSALTSVAGLALGENHSCGLLTSGKVVCWGHGNLGQLGNCATASKDRPVVVRASASCDSDLAEVMSIGAGANHTCAVLGSGQARCWGYGEKGQLGNDGELDAIAPVAVVGSGGAGALADVVAVAGGFEHTCARTRTGVAWCWGDNTFGRLGVTLGAPSKSSRPVAVEGGALAAVAGLASGYFHACVTTDSGAIKCWGYGGNGQLGDGWVGSSPSSPPNRDTPSMVVRSGPQPGFPFSGRVTVTDAVGREGYWPVSFSTR